MSARQAVLLLGAGHGTRMGEPKVFTRHGGQSFLERILRRCAEAGAPVTLCVDPGFRERVEAALALLALPRPRLVSADGTRPMLATVQAGLAAGGFETGFWLWPVDAPFISPQGWARAVARAAERPGRILKLRVAGRTGHPLWLPGWAVPEILAGDWADGLLSFLAAHEGEVEILPLDGEVLGDFNTPEQLTRAPGES
ncbi:MAG: nucleotidyltransferase family protein [Candidatus Lambdaproteobacteria bacterium]|nr:nucleotidyltransferase family protein [Candidatus Lambdaproteobacteria bacterium]